MRILHFAQNVAGGISSYFDEIAAHQVERYGRENVVFLMPGRDVRNLTNVPLDIIETFDHVDRTAPSLFRLALTARRFTERYRPDIVHLHSTFAGLIFRSILPFLRHKPKVVYCAHGWAFAREQSAVSTKLFAWIEALLMRKTDLCINISANEERLAAEHGISLRKCVTVPNGIALRGALPPKEMTPSDRAVRLLFVGRLDPQKGVDILLQAMRLLDNPSIHLQVAGAAVVSKSGADLAVGGPNVTALGHVTRDEVAQLMRDCDAIVVPSRWEGFGLVVLEAMRAGKPAIVSPNGALPDLVIDGETGLIVRPLTPEALAAALQSLDGVRLGEMGRAAYARFVDHHTSDRMNAAIDRLYEGLVAQPAPGRMQDANLPQDPISNA